MLTSSRLRSCACEQHDHYFTPGRRQYWYSSRGQGSLTEVAGSLLGSADCSITRASQGQIHDPDGTTNDLYEDQVYLNIPNYHCASHPPVPTLPRLRTLTC